MLALKSGQLLLRDRSRFFTPTLVIALIIAILLHLAPCLLFQLKRSWSTSFDQQVTCRAVADPRRSNAPLPVVDLNGLLARTIEPPNSHNPSLPMVTATSSAPKHPTPALHATNFTATLDYQPIPAGHLFDNTYRPLTITLGEGLSNRKLLINPAPRQKLVRAYDQKTHRFFLSYRVRIDERSGRIFAAKAETKTGIEAIDHRMERYIRRIVFEPKCAPEVTEGIVELTLELPQ